MNVRVIGLAAVAVCAALLPLAASAGPASGPEVAPADAAVVVVGAPGVRGAAEASQLSGTDRSAATPDRSMTAGDALTRTAERCGPEVVAPVGIEAQTCVLREGRDIWARTYYRNATGRELLSVLSLMGPRGRAVQLRCAVEAEDEPTTCETPREPSRGEASDYTAMAEFAAAVNDVREKDTGPLLLRSGSNSEAPGAR